MVLLALIIVVAVRKPAQQPPPQPPVVQQPAQVVQPVVQPIVQDLAAPVVVAQNPDAASNHPTPVVRDVGLQLRGAERPPIPPLLPSELWHLRSQHRPLKVRQSVRQADRNCTKCWIESNAVKPAGTQPANPTATNPTGVATNKPSGTATATPRRVVAIPAAPQPPEIPPANPHVSDDNTLGGRIGQPRRRKPNQASRWPAGPIA